MINLCGISLTVISQRLKAAPQLIQSYLKEQGYHLEGRTYGLEAWHAARKAFRAPPSGYSPLLVQAEAMNMDPQKAERFVWDNGGKVATFFDRTTQTIALHLNPYSVQLLSAQLVPHPLAQSQDFSRDDVARLTNRSANEFDEWVRKTREMGGKLDISWCRTKDGTKVLPHFKAKEIRLYLELNGVRLFDGLA